MKSVTVYDAINDTRNLEISIASGKEAGCRSTARCLHGQPGAHRRVLRGAVRELVKLGADLWHQGPDGAADAGARRARCSRRSMQAAGDDQVQLHSHCQSGLAPDVYDEAIKAGFRLRAYGSRAARERRVATGHRGDRGARAALGMPTRLDLDAIAKSAATSTGFACARASRAAGRAYDPALYAHQIPGGMISNLRSQLADDGMGHRLPEILEEAARVRAGPRLPNRREPVRPVHRHTGGAERDPGRALQDDSRRGAQVREGLLWPARRAAVE